MKIQQYVQKTVRRAKKASYEIAQVSTKKKNDILRDMAQVLMSHTTTLIRENTKDITFAKKQKLSSALIDRLLLTEERVKKMASAIRAVAKLADPIGKTLATWKRPNGLKLSKVSVPLGVILIIYEARPNVTSECASLCLKSNNVVILRGGKECFYTNKAMVTLFQKVLKNHDVSPECISFISTTEHVVVDELLKQNENIDLVIPRGGEGLIRTVVEKSTIPVIKHYKGICHVYVDSATPLRRALKIAINAKCQRPSVCNAMETLLVHKKVAKKFLPEFAKEFSASNGIIYGCQETRQILKEYRNVRKATTKNYLTEYLDYKVSVRVVTSIDQAIEHINTFGSGHTDAIVSNIKTNIQKFIQHVDASSVMVNATTRFSDGNEYGFGAEIGISTDKIHARGPMGLEGLTSYKYIVRGRGQIRT